MAPKIHTITVRLTQEQRDRLDGATRLGPYSIARAEIIARGIELAAEELERMGDANAPR